MPPVISVRNVCKNYGPVQALKNISLEARPGEITGLIGPDGAGKSSLMKIILGLLNREEGEVSLMGRDPGTDRTPARTRVGYMPEVFSLYTDLSVEENMAFSFRIHRGNPGEFIPRRDRLYRFNRLEKFSSTRAGSLSGGMKQKLALSCALMHDPALLVLDEPTTGVDPLSRREFWQMLKELKERGISILVSTPYMEEALQCSRISLMHRGKVLAAGSPRQLLNEYPGRITEVWTTNLPPQELRRRISEKLPYRPVYLMGKRVHISCLPGENVELKSLLEGICPMNITDVSPDLEDLFLSAVLREAE